MSHKHVELVYEVGYPTSRDLTERLNIVILRGNNEVSDVELKGKADEVPGVNQWSSWPSFEHNSKLFAPLFIQHSSHA